MILVMAMSVHVVVPASDSIETVTTVSAIGHMNVDKVATITAGSRAQRLRVWSILAIVVISFVIRLAESTFESCRVASALMFSRVLLIPRLGVGCVVTYRITKPASTGVVREVSHSLGTNCRNIR